MRDTGRNFVYVTIGEYDSTAGHWLWQEGPWCEGERMLEHVARDTNDLDADSNTTEYRTYAVHEDFQDTVWGLSDTSAAIVERYFYTDPYGASETKNAAGTNIGAFATSVFHRKRLHGGFIEAVSRLYDFRHRWYSPDVGSWGSRDPIGYFDALNLYQPLLQNPLVMADAFGLQAKPSIDDLMKLAKDMFSDGIVPKLQSLGRKSINPLSVARKGIEAFFGALYGVGHGNELCNKWCCPDPADCDKSFPKDWSPQGSNIIPPITNFIPPALLTPDERVAMRTWKANFKLKLSGIYTAAAHQDLSKFAGTVHGYAKEACEAAVEACRKANGCKEDEKNTNEGFDKDCNRLPKAPVTPGSGRSDMARIQSGQVTD